jgi:hypothetical protein
VAAIESLPAGREEVVHCAWLEARATAEQPLIAAPLAVNLTVPVGEEPSLTAAVNVTDWPTVEGFWLETSPVVVDVLLTTCIKVPLLPVLLVSPE